MGFVYEQYPTVVGCAIALLLILWPPPEQVEEEARRKERLSELDHGADEAFFEERRALETYGPQSAGPYRLWGVLLLLLSLAPLVL